MSITIHVEGARPEDIVCGLLAAQDVFDRAGVTPDQAATARFVVEGWDIRGFPEPAPELELGICGVWDEADHAAVKACCAGGRRTRFRTLLNLNWCKSRSVSG